MKKLILSGFLLISIYFLTGCKNQITSNKGISKNNNWENSEQNAKIIPGNFGPYGGENDTSIIGVAISNKIRTIAYTMNGKSYVIVNDKKFGPYDRAYLSNPLKVSDKFWSFITYKNDGDSIITVQK